MQMREGLMTGNVAAGRARLFPCIAFMSQFMLPAYLGLVCACACMFQRSGVSFLRRIEWRCMASFGPDRELLTLFDSAR